MLYRLAHRQQENFTTDAFVQLLRHLSAHEPAIAARVLDWLTESTLFSQHAPPGQLWIRTQAGTHHHVIPDIRIEDDDADLYVIVEVKLGGWLTVDQMEDYREELDVCAGKQTRLVGLVGAPPPDPLLGIGEPRSWADLQLTIRTWGEVGLKLLEEVPAATSPVTPYLVEQLVGFLRDRGLVVGGVSRLSDELRLHREWADANPGEPALTRARIRSLARVESMPHTTQLCNLLRMMQAVAVNSGFGRPALDSGGSIPRSWIGYNLQGMKYFFFIRLLEPERVIFQRYLEGVDPGSFDGTLGVLDPVAPSGLVRWQHSLDLAADDGAFFRRPDPEQLVTLAHFFTHSYTYAETLLPQSKVPRA